MTRYIYRYGLGILTPIAMIALLWYSSSTSFQIGGASNDMAKYQCYAEAFWYGIQAIHALPPQQCTFMATQTYATPFHLPAWLPAWQSTAVPLHTLPLEYPFLNLLFFSIPLLFSAVPYQEAYAILMSVILLIEYGILYKLVSWKAALALALFTVAGNWVTAITRFDVIPGVLTLAACLCMEKKQWCWGYVLLAFATLSKLYPIVLFIPFILYEQRQTEAHTWRQRTQGMTLFLGICAGVSFLSLLANVQAMLSPLFYFGRRPLETETIGASIAWIGSCCGYPYTSIISYGSHNIAGSLSNAINGMLVPLGLLPFLLLLYTLQVIKKISFEKVILFILLVVLITGKVFSPQYLLWVTPLVAYVYQDREKYGYIPWILWLAVCLATTWIYPYGYTMMQGFPFLIIAIRNILLGLFCLYCICVPAYREDTREGIRKWYR